MMIDSLGSVENKSGRPFKTEILASFNDVHETARILIEEDSWASL